jgi:hypothetical protein
MKRNLVNFTRGSQLLGHFSFMFAAGLKGPLIIAAIVIAVNRRAKLTPYRRAILTPADCCFGGYPGSP